VEIICGIPYNRCAYCTSEVACWWCALCGFQIEQDEDRGYELCVTEKQVFGAISIRPKGTLDVCSDCHAHFRFRGKATEWSDVSDWDSDVASPQEVDSEHNLKVLLSLNLTYGELYVRS
jgi:hypothetical protein